MKYDPEQDVYFISSTVGIGSVKYGAAYISRVDAGNFTRVEPFIVSRRGGVELDAPKGMVLQGDTLWVVNIDLIRAFDRRTGAPLAMRGLGVHGALRLNDLTLGPDGARSPSPRRPAAGRRGRGSCARRCDGVEFLPDGRLIVGS